MIENPKLLVDGDGAPLDRICGFETEYGISAQQANFSKAVVGEVCRLAIRNSLQYQEDGDRSYVDIGPHPELSTAEEISFLGAAHRVLHGHVKMAKEYTKNIQVTREKYPDLKINSEKVFLVANTSDVTGNSWGSHENILASRRLSTRNYIDALAVHRLSRIVWSGAGHVLPNDSATGFRFVLSERAEHLWQIAGTATTRGRAIVDLRDESLADDERFRRIHDISGESVFNPRTNALRLATGSIVLRACELGVSFEDLMPENPIRAIREISSDPTLREAVRLADGRNFTGIDLQMAVAERAIDAAVEADYLTPQEHYWAVEWLELLDDLSVDPERWKNELDWMIKSRIINRALDDRDPKTSPLAVAQAEDIKYHWLLPREGAGMQLVRKGRFLDSPSPEVLENGSSLPPTRASLRVRITQRLIEAEAGFNVEWDRLKIYAPDRIFFMDDPYATQDESLIEDIEEYLRRRHEAQLSVAE